MSVKIITVYTGKVFLCGLAFTIGSVLGSLIAGAVGLTAPVLPEGVDPASAAATLPLVGLLMGMLLGWLSARINARLFNRLVILTVFAWVAYGLNTYLESILVNPAMADPYVPLMNLVGIGACAGAAAFFFRGGDARGSFSIQGRDFFSRKPVTEWIWRMLAVFLAFPAAYYICGLLVYPFVGNYYETQYAGLTAPTLSQLLPVLALRSLLFLAAILPVIILWRGNRMSLYLSLSAALFLLVGGFYMLQGSWLPVSMRFAHSLEILADSVIHAGAIVWLLVPANLANRHGFVSVSEPRA